MSENSITFGKVINGWRCMAIIALVAFIGILAALIAVIVVYEEKLDDYEKKLDNLRKDIKDTIPCPACKGGLMTSGDPQNPSPFHDLTSAEYERLYRFLRQEAKINLADPETTEYQASRIYMIDLLLPPKQDVLSFLDSQGSQPAREARVMIFRGDKEPPVVEEYRVGPLSQPTYAELIVNPQRRNPVSFAMRPMGSVEFFAMFWLVLSKVDMVLGDILMESYGGKFTDCGTHCLTYYPTPVGTQLQGNASRKMWTMACYPAEYYSLHPVDFGVLIDLDASDPTQWNVEQVWYSGTLYPSMEDLADKYANDSAIRKTKVDYVPNSPDLSSSQRLRGDPMPETPQRPPLQMEPDGKRYTIHHRHVKYLHWDFDIRLSAFTGPQVYDVRFNKDRIAYELGLAEIAVFYSGYNPMQRVTNFVDSGALIGV